MASNSPPEQPDDTGFLIVIFVLVILFLGIAPIVVDMYLETKAETAIWRDEKKAWEKRLRELEQKQRKGSEQ